MTETSRAAPCPWGAEMSLGGDRARGTTHGAPVRVAARRSNLLGSRGNFGIQPGRDHPQKIRGVVTPAFSSLKPFAGREVETLRRKPRRILWWKLCLVTAFWIGVTGCSIFPRPHREILVHNPWPELSRVAVAPFFNHSSDPTVDGRRFARAYFEELQSVPGFQVVPVDLVERTLHEHQIQLRGPDEARRLAELLEVDVIVLGAVTHYSPYYPPRCGLHVEWYARDPLIQPIPPGFGIDWGKRKTRRLPRWIAYEAQMAEARKQFEASRQSPDSAVQPTHSTPLAGNQALGGASFSMVEDNPMWLPAKNSASVPLENLPASLAGARQEWSESIGSEFFGVPSVAHRNLPEAPNFPDNCESEPPAGKAGLHYPASVAGKIFQDRSSLEPGPPSVLSPMIPGAKKRELGPRVFPAPTSYDRPPVEGGTSLSDMRAVTSKEPVMSHSRLFSGHDPEFTKALATYYLQQEDARFGGWPGYLERSSDLIRFCCRLHIREMLLARGGAGPTRVVWQWPNDR